MDPSLEAVGHYLWKVEAGVDPYLVVVGLLDLEAAEHYLWKVEAEADPYLAVVARFLSKEEVEHYLL